jgi:hypothetical protein
MSDFKREDWTKFRSLGELPRAAGVPVAELKKLVAKELTDNALDAAGACRIGLTADGAFWVEDDGPGISGTAPQIANLFSINRPLTSSKQLRLPTRGALGNGLRVVSGYALAMRGTLTVSTSGQVLELSPHDDGDTVVVEQRRTDRTGTRVEIRLGQGAAFTSEDVLWARRAMTMAGAPTYTGDSSPFWFDEDAFWELCQAFSSTVRDLVDRLDGCKNPKSGIIAAPWKGRLAASLTRGEAAELLTAARAATKPCNAKRLQSIGPGHNGLPASFARVTGEFSPQSAGGTLRAHLPFVVEVWAKVSLWDSIEVNVNRTPISAQVIIRREDKKTDVGIIGCGIANRFSIGLKPMKLIVNVQTPYMPITSDGKAPDLLPMLEALYETITKATGSAKRHHTLVNPTERRRPETEIVRGVLDEAIAKASGDGASRFSLRQLFYQVRPFIIAELGKEPTYENFANIITDIEREIGQDLPGIYRDARGTLYHPHTGEEISLGTLAVENYERPEWTFNKILFIEKEGFFQLLKDAQWPERHDCALLSSKGQPTRAVRDVLDLMGETEQDLTFFCTHDADAAGTIIYQSLQDETKARAARRFHIINLGLEPNEAIKMGLEPEQIEVLKNGRPVAKYVSPEGTAWLQENRVELNAMTSPQFIAWLDSKMAQHDGAKLVPPCRVMEQQLTVTTRQKVKANITTRILAAAEIENQVDNALELLSSDVALAKRQLEPFTRAQLQHNAAQWWAAPVEVLAEELAKKAA